MYRPRIYEASAAQLEAVFALNDEQALAQSRELSMTHIPALGYYANLGAHYQALLGGQRNLDLGRVASELSLHITPEPRVDDSYTVAPYCIEGRNEQERLIRGIALWTRRPVEVVQPRISQHAIWYKADLLVGR